MSQVVDIEQTILEKIKTLPPDKQQVVLDFVEFLQSKSPKDEWKHLDGTPMSALEASGDLVGCVEGPGDLSLKKRNLKGKAE